MRTTSLLYLAASLPCFASFETLFTLGEDNSNPSEFSSENGQIDSGPGSATIKDDHFYVGSEELENFERALTSNDPINVLYFPLTASQALNTGILKIRADFIWAGGNDGDDSHVISFSLNGGTVAHTTPRFSSELDYVFEIPLTNETILTGENALKIERTGESPNSFVQFDFLEVQLDATALQDQDNDQLPLFWETIYQLSDLDPTDAAADFDDDSLSTLAEFLAGTNPRLSDTDQDGLIDGEEINTDPLMKDSDEDGLLDGEETLSDPTLWDTDGDGASDSFEVATGYHPANSSSTPPAWAGSIGINFRSEGNPDGSIWPTRATNGLIPQTNWNHTTPLRRYGVGSSRPLLQGGKDDIFSPMSSQLVDAAGQITSLNFTFTYDGCSYTETDQSLATNLLSSFLNNATGRNDAGQSIQKPATITLSNIPYSSYDLYVYVSSNTTDPQGLVTRNGGDEREVSPLAVGDRVYFREHRRAASERAPRANVIVYENLTGPSQVLAISRLNNQSGFSGIQLVNRTPDSDGDQVPDFWELRHRTNATLSNATTDLDGDGLNLAEEFALGSDPQNPDSDHDGLNDLGEQEAGTSPNYGDSDDDGISDSDELLGALPSDPLSADSDNDGLNDFEEREAHSDPEDSSVVQASAASYPNSNRFLWEDTDIQLVIDHFSSPETRGGSDRTLLEWLTFNLSAEGYRPLRFRLREREGRLIASASITSTDGIVQENGRSIYVSTPQDEDAYRDLGFAGRGSHDLSDPLTFRLVADRNAGAWSLGLFIINQRTNINVLDFTFENVTLSAGIANQTAEWGTRDNPGLTDFNTGYGVRIFRTKKLLHTLPSFSAYQDSDNDGMPDAWEITHGFNPNLVDDAGQDFDQDGLSNVDEFDLGTLPRNPDSDNDLISDKVERDQFSDPLSAQSRPHHLASAPSRNTDLNNNNLPDLWEARYQISGLSAGADSDGDGYTNLEESIMGTDPLDSASHFRIRMSKSSGNDNSEDHLTLQYPRLFGKNQTLMSSNDLSGFRNHPESPQALGDIYSLSITPGTSDKNFYRVVLSDLDSDGDGLTNWEEILLGTSPSAGNSISRPVPYDLDQDGTPDGTIPGDYSAFVALIEDRADLNSGATATNISPRSAARLLMQASFGPTLQEIRQVQQMGIAAWIDDQIENQPATRHRTYLREITADFEGPRVMLDTYNNSPNNLTVHANNIQTSFARAAISGPDQLRQRVAFALSQILVVSRQDGQIGNRPHSIAKYYDQFVDQAFGNYEDLLYGVTMSPIMGSYLSSIGNQKADPSINRFPDENFAREVQQLFSIGLWELNLDGTRKKDQSGNDIPTYNNDDVTEFARVFTGLWFGNQRWGGGGYLDAHFQPAMDMFPDYHDFDSKRLLNGFVIPKREPSMENGLQDIRDTIRHLVAHPSCAPFISKALIQFLVTSNPSPEYVTRVSQVFIGDGTRRPGDLKAVIKAILLDPEARDPAASLRSEYGIFREPVIRSMHLARILKLNRSGDLLWWDNGNYFNTSLQMPLYSPSVFNFFRPDYSPQGELSDRNLTGPAFEILNSYTSISFPNQLWDTVNRGIIRYRGTNFTPELSDFLPFVNEPEALLDQINLITCAGSMSAKTREIILTALSNADQNDKPGLVRLAIYLAAMSPEGATQR